MKHCWSLNAEERPTFEKIQQFLGRILDVSSDAYGYLDVSEVYWRYTDLSSASALRPEGSALQMDSIRSEDQEDESVV